MNAKLTTVKCDHRCLVATTTKERNTFELSIDLQRLDYQQNLERYREVHLSRHVAPISCMHEIRLYPHVRLQKKTYCEVVSCIRQPHRYYPSNDRAH